MYSSDSQGKTIVSLLQCAPVISYPVSLKFLGTTNNNINNNNISSTGLGLESPNPYASHRVTHDKNNYMSPGIVVENPRVAGGAPGADLGVYLATLIGLINWYNGNASDRIPPLIHLTCPKKRSRVQASLRRLDHIVRNVLRTRPGLAELHADYKTQIHLYRRYLFDPFCRSRTIYLKITTGDPGNLEHSKHGGQTSGAKPGKSESMHPTVIRTCAAQLNFVRWVIDRNVISSKSIISPALVDKSYTPGYCVKKQRSNLSNASQKNQQ